MNTELIKAALEVGLKVTTFVKNNVEYYRKNVDREIAAINEALAELDDTNVGQRQPIETAPKDMIILLCDYYSDYVCIGMWDYNKWREKHESYYEAKIKPTHWPGQKHQLLTKYQ